MKVKDDTNQKIIRDFTILSSILMGNNFIPDIPDICICFDMILSSYFEVKERFLIVNGSFNKYNLCNFIQALINNLIEEYGEKNHISNDKRKEAYDKYVLSKFQVNDENLITQISQSLIDSFYWILGYYTNECASWDWSFNYHYSPPLQYVLNYIQEYWPNFEKGKSRDPILYLFSLVTEHEKTFLPQGLASLITDGSQIYEYFSIPKNREELQFINNEELKRIYEECLPKFIKKEKSRAKLQRINKFLPTLSNSENEQNKTKEPKIGDTIVVINGIFKGSTGKLKSVNNDEHHRILKSL